MTDVQRPPTRMDDDSAAQSAAGAPPDLVGGTEVRARPPRLSRRIASELTPYRGSLVGGTLLSLAAVPLALLLPVPLKIAVDNAINGKPLSGPLAAVVPPSIENSPARLLAFAAVFLFRDAQVLTV